MLKQCFCQAEDPGSIPGSGRSSGEGNGSSLQHSCLGISMDRGTWQCGLKESIDFPLFFSFQSFVALYFFFTLSLKMIICLVFPFTSLFYLASLVAQLIKNLPAMQKMWVWFLGWEDPLEKGKATYSSVLAWKIPWTVYSPWGCKVSGRIDRLSLSFTMFSLLNIT